MQRAIMKHGTERTSVTGNLFRSANLFRRNLFASGSVPDFQKISEFVPDGQRSMFQSQS